MNYEDFGNIELAIIELSVLLTRQKYTRNIWYNHVSDLV